MIKDINVYTILEELEKAFNNTANIFRKIRIEHVKGVDCGWLNKSVRDLPGISKDVEVRIQNCFEWPINKNGRVIQTIKDLTECTSEELLNIPGFGGGSLKSLKKSLSMMGLQLSDEDGKIREEFKF